MKALYDKIAIRSSRDITKTYSTSFSLGIKLLSSRLRDPIYAIYGFVRLADEIVDSFHGYSQSKMLAQLKKDVFKAIEDEISINPVLHSFQYVVREYNIDKELISSFLESMEMDLQKHYYTRPLYDKYIYGSAEVVGLMCLKVFCENDKSLYEELKYPAMKLGSAFQKVNFLRDIKSDSTELGRVYFPHVNLDKFSEAEKINIEKEIAKDFKEALKGILRLPRSSQKGVYLAYRYYQALLKRIQLTPANKILATRIRVPDTQKIAMLCRHLIVQR